MTVQNDKMQPLIYTYQRGKSKTRKGERRKCRRKHQRRKKHVWFTVSSLVHCFFFFHPSCSLLLLSSLLFLEILPHPSCSLFLLSSLLLPEIFPWLLTNLRHLKVTSVPYFSFIMRKTFMWLGIIFYNSSYSYTSGIIFYSSSYFIYKLFDYFAFILKKLPYFKLRTPF